MSKKRILFLAYFFPPFNGIASVRTKNIALHLSDLGWEVTVVTPHPELWAAHRRCKLENEEIYSQINFIYTDHKLKFLNHYFKNNDKMFGKLFKGVFRRFSRMIGIDSSIGWNYSTLNLSSTIKEEKFDVILASGPPFTSFVLANKLSKSIGIPFVIDYRDGWTQGAPFTIRRPLAKIDLINEKEIIEQSSAIITNSKGLMGCLNARFNSFNKTTVITNGYDPNEIEKIAPYNFNHLALVYTGGFYPPKRVLSPIFKALKIINRKSAVHSLAWQFHYYGHHSKLFMKEANYYDFNDFVVDHGFVPRDEALSANCGASLSIVINSITSEVEEDVSAVVPGKLFDMIGLGSRILLISPHGSNAETILNESRLGQCFSGEEVEKIADYIFYCLINEKTESPPFSKYSWENLSNKFDNVLISVMKNS